jgi:2-polyprenyl-6-methoxyphenol hydroxylase-like FAD-dependent oxidoreductase
MEVGLTGAEWNKDADFNQFLKVYEGFDPRLLALAKKADPTAMKVWQLMDMEKLPTWTKGKLALLGDAAHPFTPRKYITDMLLKEAVILT